MAGLGPLLAGLLALSAVGGSGYALTSVTSDPIIDPVAAAFSRVDDNIEGVGVLTCGWTTVQQTPLYRNCNVQSDEVVDNRKGSSYTTTVTAEVCRREPSGNECVGTTQTVGRTGAEAYPSAEHDSASLPVPQACIGSTCTPSGAVPPVPGRVTVFGSGTAPEVSVYTATGVVNVNAPQACVSINDGCSTTGSTGTPKAGTENVSATQVVTTQ